MILDETLKDGEMRIYKDLHNGWVEEQETINVRQTGKTYQMINDMQQQINNLNKFIKEYGNYLDSLHLDDKGIVYRAREKWNLLLKGIDDNEN